MRKKKEIYIYGGNLVDFAMTALYSKDDVSSGVT